MKKDYVLLNAFRLDDRDTGGDARAFDDYLVPDPGPLDTYDLGGRHPFAGRLYVSKRTDKEPPWAGYLRNGFSDLPKLINRTTNRALLIVALDAGGKKLHFAFAFGFGRHLLDPSGYVHDYGLKVALNAIYRGIPKKEGVDTNLIRSLDIKTVSGNTIHTRRQSNRSAAFEMFGVDVQRDILRSITGRPSGEKEWGTRISGGDSVSLTCPVDFKDLGERCRMIEELYQGTDYRDFLSWVDHIKPVTNPALQGQLEAELLTRLADRGADPGNLELAPPEIVDWDRIKGFSFSFDPDQTYKELELGGFLAALDRKGRREGLTIKQLKSAYRVEAFDVDDEPVGSWGALQCLCGELPFDGRTYILEEGTFSAVDDRYRLAVDDYIGSIEEYAGAFPACKKDWKEDDFNGKSAKQPNFLLLHKHPVSLPEKTTPIEVCDLLSDDRCFIHVKPKFSSSTLSHLFSQGFVSGELFCTSPDFRNETLRSISKALRQKTKKAPAAVQLDRFATFEAQSVDPRRYKVVYAIIGNWGDKGFKDKLPFFSKLNLRRFTQDLRNLGYEVMCRRIQQP